MTNLARIQSTLNAAANVGSPDAPVGDLWGLFEKLNRIVLPREVTLNLTNGAELKLTAGHRRLLGMTSNRTGAAPWGDDLSAGDEKRVVDALAKELSEHAVANSSEIALSQGAEASGLGLAVSRLLELIGPASANPTRSALPSLLKSFVARYAGEIEASFIADSQEIAPLTGEHHVIEERGPEVADILARATSEDSALASTLETDGALAFPQSTAEETCILIVGCVGTYGAIVFRHTSAHQAMEYWKAA
ncbi:hypothetical protein [Gymnodinialimonas hymeniacidonis]|uniref:hypothetical protein n=1 Tax=Gymnodinialimonas hymeniacidonis TaxID=3126508 RepID=UPI0034C5EB98